MEPYPYEVSGDRILLTNLVMPIVVNQKFRGIVGVDVELPLFKTLVDELSQSLYGGQSKGHASPLGLIIASAIIRISSCALAEAMPQLGESLKSLHIGSGLLDSDDSLYIAKSHQNPNREHPVVLTDWLPKSVAMAD